MRILKSLVFSEIHAYVCPMRPGQGYTIDLSFEWFGHEIGFKRNDRDGGISYRFNIERVIDPGKHCDIITVPVFERVWRGRNER